MGILAELLFRFVRKGQKYVARKNSQYIFYKIVDFTNKSEYMLQCINTKATFQSSIIEIVFDTDILYSLHPTQSCYIGIEYAKLLKQSSGLPKNSKSSTNRLPEYCTSRYGRYSACYQNRKGEVCFIDKNTKEKFLMDPRDIALSKELIQHFDAAQSFYIGLLAGLKLHNPIKYKPEKLVLHQHPHLSLVK